KVTAWRLYVIDLHGSDCRTTTWLRVTSWLRSRRQSLGSTDRSRGLGHRRAFEHNGHYAKCCPVAGTQVATRRACNVHLAGLSTNPARTPAPPHTTPAPSTTSRRCMGRGPDGAWPAR